MDERTGAPGHDTFAAAAARVVDYLNEHTPLTDWSVTRVAGGEQVHLHVHGEDLLAVGDRVRWDDSFCRRMTEGAAPVVVDSLLDPDYADLEPAQRVRSYAGQPIGDGHGGLFGVLCGVGASPLASVTEVDLALVKTFGDVLADHLRLAREADERRLVAQLSEVAARTDALTGLVNRRGWEALVDDAAARAAAFGDLSAVVVIDLDGLKAVNDTQGHLAGDALLRRAAGALQERRAAPDQVARVGGDEFTVLVADVGSHDLERHVRRYRQALADAGVEASVGHAIIGPGDRGGIEAFSLADAAMYEEKRRRRTA